MNKKMLKWMIGITIIFLLLGISYKIYLILHEKDFVESNYQNIKKMDSSEQGEEYAFAVIGSAKNSFDVFQQEIIHDINADTQIDFVISTGDAVMDGAEDKYRILNHSLHTLNVPALIGIGKNEISDSGYMRFYRHFGPFYFSFSYGKDYFIFLDTTGTTSYNLQEGWLKGELAKAREYNHTFVVMDDGPLEKKGDKGFGDTVVKYLSEYEVTSVFYNGDNYMDQEELGVAYHSSGKAGGIADSKSYGYLKVSVKDDTVTVGTKKVISKYNSAVTRTIAGIWFAVRSVIYIQLVNILLVMAGLLLLCLILYRKMSKSTDYYKNFNAADTEIRKDRKLTIAMFTNNYFPFVGGVPISIMRLASALRKNGNKVIIFAPAYPEEDESEQDVVRCRLIHYRKSGKFQFAIANIYDSKIAREFERYPFDLVHVHHPFWMGKEGLRLAKKVGIPVVLTYHTRLEMYSENLPFGKLFFKNILSHKMIKRFAQQCDGIIAPTISAKDYLENVGVSRQKLVVPTGIELRKFQNIDTAVIHRLRNRFVKSEELLMCSVFRLSPEKNADFLIEGLQLVKDKAKVGFKCIIIGDGPARENIQELIRQKGMTEEILLLGKIPPEDMAQYYLAADLFVFSSQSETQGMVLLEAMAGKCPVVCVRSSGTDDAVINNYNGYKTAANLQEWADKIVELMESNSLREQMSKNAEKYAVKFSIENTSERIETFYRRLISLKKNQTKES
ncbi:glycosyltransferase [Hespellia stercorisuis]|uniref:Glycosyltransferase involved in cell wall bisynthesis n=1 Tax=Hespellia stercorisuis DSM 15480 TaxID=1121950 RepID=A0A1M6I892_9FIRM|nr:glycosyltransferase [Hespellia stercorisuis]SHJ30662.1 Glycosyltransferase involved in cell wall bisynthesis [Hespellia stercorisuis DSM 15480]